MNQKVIITRGLSGAGKSTWSLKYVKEHTNFVRISRDELRFMFWDGDFSEQWEEVVIRMRDNMILAVLGDNFNLVLDETFLAKHRIKEILRALGAYVSITGRHLDIEIQDFIDVDIETCIKNDSTRGRNKHVGEEFIRDYFDKYVRILLKDRGVTKWTI